MTDAAMSRGPRRAQVRGLVSRGVVAALAAVLFAWRHDDIAAIAVLGMAATLTGTSFAWPAAGERIDRAFSAAGRAIGATVAVVAVGAIDLFVGLPGRAVAKVMKRDSLTGLSPRTRTTWRATPTASRVDAQRAFGGDLPRRLDSNDRPRTTLASLARCVGVLVVLVVLDAVLGAGARLIQPTSSAGVFADHLRLHRVGELAPFDNRPLLVPPVSPATSKAESGEPWHATLRQQEQATAYHWQPYITFEAVNTTSSLVNIRDGVRRSWEPPRAAGSLPVVWFFGGSTMQGIGQRDDHTIPSDVARLALAAGRPITVVNFGVVGATNYTEALQLEQQLAVRQRPNLVVFYDGATDSGVQAFYPSSQPTQPPATLVYRSTSPSLFDRWRSNSFAYRLLRHLDRSLFPPAGAASLDRPPGGSSPATVARDTVGLYRRGMDLAGGMLPAGVTPLFFWQPTRWSPGSPTMAAIRASLPANVIDLSDTFDHERSPVYLDPIHTNELGAQLIAERMWATIGRHVR